MLACHTSTLNTVIGVFRPVSRISVACWQSRMENGEYEGLKPLLSTVSTVFVQL